jgi:hypothetical protein
MSVELSILSTTRSGHNFIKEVIESWGDYKVTVMERALPINIHQYHLDPRGLRVIVIRDFKNCIASSIKSFLDAHGRDSGWRDNISTTVDAYWAQVEEAIIEEYYDAHTIIYYDRFCEDQTYREVICALLGGTYTESRLGYVSNEGNGSSWDKLSLQGEGQKMRTRDRHEQILETEWVDIYTQVLEENKELMKKYETFFEGLR